MTDPLVFDNLTYIPMKDAAAGSRLSTEYLARLARSGRIRDRIIAHMWFIEMHSLQQFLSARPARPPRTQHLPKPTFSCTATSVATGHFRAAG